jgi:hypothetical protein
MSSAKSDQLLTPSPDKRPGQLSGAKRYALAWLILFSCLVGVTALPAQIPGDFKIEAFSGSYAPWGFNQSLTIEPTGEVSFYQMTLNENDTDSAFAALDSATMHAIYDTVVAINFFALDSVYDLGALDGSGIVFRITSDGMVHSVETINIAVPEINRLALYLNSILVSEGIEIKYGAIND